MQSATQKWLPRISAEILCEIPVRRRGSLVGECDHFGVAPCDVCGRATCLQHGRIDAAGDIICFECIKDAQQLVPPARRERARRTAEESAQEPRRRTQGERARERRQAHGEAQGAGAPPRGQQRQTPPNPNQVTPEMISKALHDLGLRPGATWDDVRAAHRKISGANHPDRFSKKSRREQKEASDKYLAAQQALEVLGRVMNR